MRIRRLDLTRYGKFTDAALDFGDRPEGAPDLHIVYGLNEAGKSTALSATLDLLFGIEERSRYNFLHPYTAMEIGARLEFDGATHHLVRRKQRTGSLTDGEGRPANEALISGALSGLGRDAYRTMFSLDDETLEEGGNAILQSRGDLGELLFSASAGLAQIGATLGKAADEADAIHKKRARSTEIAGLKQRLADLKARREALDTAASAYQALALTCERTGKAYDAEMSERGKVKAALDRATRLLKAGPDAAQYRAIAGDLRAYEALPRAPEAWGRELPALRDAETRIATQVEVARERAAGLAAEIDTFAPDEAILSLRDDIRALRDAMSRYATAEEDLPRRRTALAEREAAVASLLDRLGRGGHADPAALLLPAAVTGRLRELIEARSGVETRLRTAEEEFARASEAFETARRGAERPATESAGEGASVEAATTERALRRLADALRRVRESDAPVRLRLAANGLPQAERRLAAAMSALGTFEGDAEALAALVPPEARRIESWRASLADLEHRRMRHREKRREHADEAAQADARLDAIRRAAGPIDDAEALRLREARNAAWTDHRAKLDATSASAFEAALDADDRIVEARFSRMQDLAELRQFGAALGAAEAGVTMQEARIAEVEAEARQLFAEIAESVPPHLAPTAEGRMISALDRIEAFAARRTEALAAAATLADLVAAERTARGEAEAERQALAEACRSAGALDEASGGEGSLPVAELASIAEDRIERCRMQGAEQAAASKALAEREAQLQRRREARHEAVEASKHWQADWAGALAGRWIDPAEGVGATREILGVLADLSPALQARDEMRHRVETMVADQDALADRLAVLLRRLGRTPPDAPPPRIVQALSADLDEAERIAALARDRAAELETEEGRVRALSEELRLAAARKAEMTGLFGVETLAEVSNALERVAGRARLEKRLAELGRSLAANLRTADVDEALAALDGADLPETEREAGELEARQEDLDARLRELFAEKTKAADALDAIGGDGEVARLQMERQTVLIEMEEAARRHLRLRAGALVAEEALRKFRDRHRSTMMGRASEAFAAMTRGDYAGLSARPEKDRETLIGLSREGGSKLATDMSKGTRFQLYLALRLAGYEEFAGARRAVPFLADDIMETFDEPRSEEVLRLLAGMARIGQVVYFTHHRHLCDIAETVEPGVRIHRL